MLLALSLEGIAGVWGVCGEIGLPGDEEVDMDVPAIIGGTLESCRLEELDERCSNIEEDMESDNAAFESRIRWNLDKAAVVRRVEASTDAESLGAWKLLRSFFVSSSFRKSEILSSSVWSDPELPPPSARIPEPGWATDDVRLVLPLLLLSSSVLLAPPDDSLALL